jgi:hypothetical protein
LGRGGGCEGRIDGLYEAVLMVDERRLRVLGGCGGVVPCLAEDDAVCATRCAGSLIGRVGERGLGLMKPPVVTVPEDALDFALPPRSPPAFVGVSFIGIVWAGSAAACSGIEAGFFESARLGAGVGVGGISLFSAIFSTGFGVRRFSARLRMTLGDGLKPDFCSLEDGAMGGELSSACVSGRDSLVALLTLVLVTEGTFIVSTGMCNCLSAPRNGVGASLAIAFSGTASA